MSAPISKDLVTGGVLVVVGVAWAAQAMLAYEIGTLRRMGPGMFPAALGLILAGFGAAIAIRSFGARLGQSLGTRFGPSATELRQGLLVLASIAAFALLVQRTGLFSAIIALSLLASMAGRQRRWQQHLTLAAVLCAMAWAIFSLGLGLTVPLVRWPF